MRRGKASARRSPCNVFSERGQTFPFVVTLLLALFIVVATVINVGQAVNRRIFLQIAADAGAFTGATEMARGMNTVASLNRRIHQAWAGLTYATMGFTVTTCPASDAGVIGYATVVRATNELINRVNTAYGQRAHTEAERVTRFNAEDLFPGERVQMAERDAATGLASRRPSDHLVDLERVPDGTPPVVQALSLARSSARWVCLAGLAALPRNAVFRLWFQKRGTDPIDFVWVVKARPIRARFFDSFFGPDLIPAMTAVAAAKPVGGEIKRAEAEYVAKLVPVRDRLGSIWDRRRLRIRSVLH